MAFNIMASWGGHAVFVVAGFLMPRLIDEHLGQSSLGIWDFSWSIVSYFVLAQVGVGSSVNRYISKFRTAGDVDGLRRTASSVNVIQMTAALFAAVVALSLSYWLPVLFGERLGVDAQTARWVIGLLGMSIVAQMLFNVYGGVLTGCHRWDLHNGLNAATYGTIVVGMVTTLVLGGGLPAISAVYLLGTVGGELMRVRLAYQVCPELRVHPSLATRQDVRTLLSFGGKTVIDSLSRLLLGQANAILVASHLGPAALAVYARPGALVRHADTLTNKSALLLSPAASSLKTSAQHDEVKTLFVQATRHTAFAAMSVTVFLAMMGDPILMTWMGDRYNEGTLMAVVALGNFLPLTQRPAQQVLIGLNRHGRIGWASFAVALIGVGTAIFALGPLKGGLVVAALTLVVPHSIGNGLFVMLYACRVIGVPVRENLRRAFLPPLLCAMPFAAVLLGVRMVTVGRPVLSLLTGIAASALVLGPLYWRFLMPPTVRRQILDRAWPPSRARARARRTAAVTPPHDDEALPHVTLSSEIAAQAETAVELRPVPYPYKSALAICSDLDETPDSRVYLESARYLNTTDDTSMGRGVGLEVGNTLYFDMPSDQFAYWNTDDAGRAMARALIRSGHIDCLHSFGDLATTRADAERSLEDLDRHGCHFDVWIDHAVARTNLGADIMQGMGDLPGSPAYHADLTCAAGVRFVWRGRVTSVIGQDVPRSLRGIWNAANPSRSSRTVLKEATKGLLARRSGNKYAMHASNDLLREEQLRGGQKVYEFLRANPHFGGVSCGDNASGLPEVLTPQMLDTLVARRGLMILYTHLGKIRSASEPFAAAARAAFQHLADRRDAGDVLVTTTRRLLGFASAMRRIEGTVNAERDGGVRVDLRLFSNGLPLKASDLDGVTVYVPDAARTRLFVEGREFSTLQRNPPDDTGRPSVTIPWSRLEFPQLCA